MANLWVGDREMVMLDRRKIDLRGCKNFFPVRLDRWSIKRLIIIKISQSLT
jgi:hypothetical protein